MNGEDRCESCGKEFGTNAHFCRHCGTPRTQAPASSDAPTRAQSPAQPPTTMPSQDPYGPPPATAAQPPSGYLAPGYLTGPPGYGPPPGYAAPPGYGPPPPGYPTPPAGYPAQPAYVPAPYETQQEPSRSNGWLIGGVAAAVLAIAGIGVGIYVAASGGSGGQARLVSTPVVTAAPAATAQPTPSPAQPAPSHSHQSQSSPSLSPSVTPSPRTRISEGGERQAVANTIQRHFSLITQHNFSAAYALLAPSLQTGESSWVESHRADGIYNVNVAVDATVHSPESATAAIVKMTTLDGHGCKNWSGSWGLTKIGGQWRISESNISSNPC